jgi:hypothetical protein
MQFCDKSFKRPQDLKKHERIHNDEEAPKRNGLMSHKVPISPPHSNYSDGNFLI